MSKKIIIILVLAGLIFGAALVFYLTRPKTAENFGQQAEQPQVQAVKEAPEQWVIVDSDHDGLEKTKEQEFGTDPTNPDTDGDGLLDGREIKLGRNPLTKDFNMGEVDKDKDGLTDNEEGLLGSDPENADTDGDGFSDFLEFTAEKDFLNAEEGPVMVSAEFVQPVVDLDKDRLSDDDEKIFGTNPEETDTDQDGLNDYDEVRVYLTDPLNPDTDGDGYKDGEEVEYGYNPSGPGKL